MSRSYRKVAKFPVCCVGHKGIRDWKKFSRKHRRANEKEQMNGIMVDEEGYDEETCTPIKYQKDRSTNDWTGPHDGWNTIGPKTCEHCIEENLKDFEENGPDGFFHSKHDIEKFRWHCFSK